MSAMDAPSSAPELRARLAALGRSLGEREAAHAADREAARQRAVALHAWVAEGLEAFHAAAAAAGSPHLAVCLGAPRTDDKHLRSVEFDLVRGRHRAIVTVKSRGETTLVGPFRAGGTEGPCQSFPFEAEADLRAALVGFLERFLEEAAAP